MSHFEDLLDDEPEYVSKTQLKQQADALQQLGKQLVELPNATLKTFPLDEELAESIALAQRINRKKDGFRRQLQFIGKLLRQRDTEALEQALASLQTKHKQANAAFHALEQTRDNLIAQGDNAIQALMETHPALDRQRLRQLIRQAKKEAEQNKPPKAYRELFQYLKAHTLQN
ncbi:MAG: ribosome biogenesis factor YjgA [Glaciecola sp.]|jgi:ribosome-associated protein